jgi:uncharacterized membrane protein
MLATLATSFAEPGKVTFYNVVLFLHITAAVVAFGVTFSYPLVFAYLGRTGYPGHAAFFHRAQERIGKYLITPAATLILLTGIYLASTGVYDFGDAFVTAGLVIIIVLLGMGGAFFSPRERRLADLAERDARSESRQPSEEYLRARVPVERAGQLSGLLVIVAIFLMVTKLGV